MSLYAEWRPTAFPGGSSIRQGSRASYMAALGSVRPGVETSSALKGSFISAVLLFKATSCSSAPWRVGPCLLLWLDVRCPPKSPGLMGEVNDGIIRVTGNGCIRSVDGVVI
ncbi:hypothetical protein H1C71_036107 [Ictidomys tridecemlineatus]|nr:hypothetical protein H1C71_036107 [Ictidomys tridecemlineatus]